MANLGFTIGFVDKGTSDLICRRSRNTLAKMGIAKTDRLDNPRSVINSNRIIIYLIYQVKYFHKEGI